MPQDALQEAQALVLSVLIPREEAQYLGVADATTPEPRVIAFTTHRLIECRDTGTRREWRSLWWPEVAGIRLTERDGEDATLVVEGAQGRAVVLAGLKDRQGRALLVLAESLRHAQETGADPRAFVERSLFQEVASLGGEARPEPPDFECGECGGPVEDTFQVCPYCTAPLQEGCPGCGKEVQTDFTVCPYCAAPLVPSPLDDTPPRLPATAWVDLVDPDEE